MNYYLVSIDLVPILLIVEESLQCIELTSGAEYVCPSS